MAHLVLYRYLLFNYLLFNNGDTFLYINMVNKLTKIPLNIIFAWHSAVNTSVGKSLIRLVIALPIAIMASTGIIFA